MNLIIAGGTCSGKTTLANKISFSNQNTTIMPEDNYFKDLQNVPKYHGRYLMDSINAFHYDEYYKDSHILIQEGSIKIPKYDISLNKRISKELLILKKQLNIFEGLHTIQILSDLPDSLKVFLDVDLKECLRRRIERDSKKYNISSKIITDYFNECIIPMYNQYISLQRNMADVIIKEGENAECMLKKYIKR